MRNALRHRTDGRGAARIHQPTLQVEHLAVDRQEAELSLDAGESFIEVNGLGDVVHGADIEPFNFTLL